MESRRVSRFRALLQPATGSSLPQRRLARCVRAPMSSPYVYQKPKGTCHSARRCIPSHRLHRGRLVLVDPSAPVAPNRRSSTGPGGLPIILIHAPRIEFTMVHAGHRSSIGPPHWERGNRCNRKRCQPGRWKCSRYKRTACTRNKPEPRKFLGRWRMGISHVLYEWALCAMPPDGGRTSPPNHNELKI